jgi:hypothetical protein
LRAERSLARGIIDIVSGPRHSVMSMKGSRGDIIMVQKVTKDVAKQAIGPTSIERLPKPPTYFVDPDLGGIEIEKKIEYQKHSLQELRTHKTVSIPIGNAYKVNCFYERVKRVAV